MTPEQENEIFNEAIQFFGLESQKIMAIEEMSELIKELSKELRHRGDVDHIAEEIADVEITLSQLKILYDVHDKVIQTRDFKLNRLHNSIQKLKAEKK